MGNLCPNTNTDMSGEIIPNEPQNIVNLGRSSQSFYRNSLNQSNQTFIVRPPS